MLQVGANEHSLRTQSLWPDEPATQPFDIHRVLRIARRQWPVVVLGALAGAILCVAYLAVATPRYTATTTLLVDTLTARSLEDGSSSAVPIVDSLAVDSQVEVIRSQNVIADVINTLDLPSKAPFAAGIGLLPAALGRLTDLLTGDDDAASAGNTRTSRMRATGKQVARELDVKRLGRSYVLQISYTSADAQLAADIANGFADAYLRDQLEARQAAAREASAWLQVGLQEIRQKSIDADLALQRFRAESRPAPGADGSAPEEALAQLRELEREADSLRSLRQNLTLRFEQAAQEQSFPVAEARVIGTATVPDSPSYPSKPLFLAAALLLGAFAGAGVGLLREYGDRFFRTGAQVRDELDLEYIGPLPHIAGDTRAGAGLTGVMSHVIEHPLSRFAETLRATRVAADIALQGKWPKVIGVVSLASGEGKSTAAKNLASLIAQQGARTLLIDGDLRQPNLSRALSPRVSEGLFDVLLHGRAIDEVLTREENTGLWFLPSVQKGAVAHAGDLLASSAMHGLMSQLGERFDYIIIDLPPLGAVVDARAAASMISGFLLVVEWGRTSRSAVREAIDGDSRIRDRCIGVVMSKVPPKAAALYDPDHGADLAYGASSLGAAAAPNPAH